MANMDQFAMMRAKINFTGNLMEWELSYYL